MKQFCISTLQWLGILGCVMPRRAASKPAVQNTPPVSHSAPTEHPCTYPSGNPKTGAYARSINFRGRSLRCRC